MFMVDFKVHTKKRNRLHQRKMNQLVYVMYNLKMKGRHLKRKVVAPFEDIESDDEWITEEGGEEFDEEDEDIEHNVSNVDLAGSSSQATVDVDAIKETFTSDEDSDEDDDEELSVDDHAHYGEESDDDNMEDVGGSFD